MPHNLSASDKKVILIILIALAIKILPAITLAFGNDEVYYWTYARHLQLNYFDHPPMVALLIRACTILFNTQSEITLRFGSLACSAIAAWIIYSTAKNLHSEQAGFIAALLFCGSFYASFIAGFLVMPDAPQVMFWCLTLYFFERICDKPGHILLWIMAGLTTGLCILSKVHGVFLPGGLVLFALIFRREWLRLPALWAYLALSVLFAAPILIWNVQNDFITFRFHSERVVINSLRPHFPGFFREIAGEFFYNNPVNVVLAAIAVWGIQKSRNRKPFELLLCCTALPMITVLLVLALFRDTLPHWSGPAYITLIVLSAVYFQGTWSARRNSRVSLASVAIAGFGFIVLSLLIELYPGTLGSTDTKNYGRGDITLDMYGWKEAGHQFRQIVRQRHRLSKAQNPGIMVAAKWFPAAHEEYYLSGPAGMRLVGLGTLNDLHQYWWSNAMLPKALSMSSAYCVVPSNLYTPPNEQYKAYYTFADSISRFLVRRNGLPARYFTVYLLHGWNAKVPVWPIP